ncbi:MAG: hypothetical protein ACI9R3_000447 [Verrucomicrobiales bacterium]|jgi:hypothetical protein
MSLTDRAQGSTPMRRLMLYIVFVIVAFVYVLFDESFWDIAGKAQSAVDERNAHNLVDIYRAAAIAKPDKFESLDGDVSATVRLLVDGVEGTGTFADMTFRVPLDAKETARAEKYLHFEQDELQFRTP